MRKKILSCLATIGVITCVIGAASADGENFAVTVAILLIGAVVTAGSLMGMKAGEQDAH